MLSVVKNLLFEVIKSLIYLESEGPLSAMVKHCWILYVKKITSVEKSPGNVLVDMPLTGVLTFIPFPVDLLCKVA